MQAPYDQFILFGDSITECSNEPDGFSFASAIQNAYARKLDVINRGFSGYTTNHALEILPEFFPSPSQAKVRLLLIFFGANDLNRGLSTKEHVPLPQFISNLKTIIYHPLIQAHSPKIILVTPGPVDEATSRIMNIDWANSDEPRRVSWTREYRDAVKRVGEEEGLGVVDIWSAIMGACGWKEGDDPAEMPGLEENGIDKKLTKLLYDGLHFSGEAYKILFEEVTKFIAEKYPDQTPENIKKPIKMQWEIDLGW
ncbi:putative gdsl lipase acylhydrolase family protein [Botrytis cinerea BcDW1]|uniref:Similar to GDSL Lipase/Acylhydrolase family protein n=2 Tax=Botryotinia fuckeliana TaxID=40559 RepID=G2YUG1_BOTF4|nr:putative gdsl lipase acylhydrolase family protein [Botrytis cinerea BcDW1]CCD55259.1 similar to GDSL Lipase/Acylhydrolase family protein [Botrytis cinerea T4]